MNTVIYVNGKRVTKEELSKIEMQNEDAKRIFAEHLRGKNSVEGECENGQRYFV